MPETYGLTHLALAVRNTQRTLTFYRTVLGMEVMYHQEKFLQLTTPGAHDILVFEEKQHAWDGRTGGIGHFGFRLRNALDMESVMQKLNAAGADILESGEFVPGSPYVYFKDPDGYTIEVWYEAITSSSTTE
jgi:catechol 2,3-dioxygenase-like lactoylglutathione lyase family enzyme